jgi:outer membrane protein
MMQVKVCENKFVKRAGRFQRGLLKIAAIFILGSFSTIHAESQSVDLLTIYEQAVENDSGLKQAKFALEQKLELVPQAESLILPSVSATLGVSWLNQDESGQASPTDLRRTGANAGISLSQPLYNRGAFALNRQATAVIEAAQKEYIAAQQSLVSKVVSAYFNVLAAQDNVTFAESEKLATARQLEQSQKRHEFGQIASTDVYEAKARYDLTLAELISARNALRSSKEALSELTGAYYDSIKFLDTQMPLMPPEPQNEAYWSELALSQNPSILALNQAVIAAKEMVEYRRSDRYPTVSLGATLSHDTSDNRANGASFDRDRTTTQVGVTLAVPLYTGGAIDSRVREANLAYMETMESLEGTRRSLLKQIKDAYWGVFTTISRIEALSQALQSAEVALESTETGYEVGTRTIVDVLTTQTMKHRAERDLKLARYSYLINLVGLKLAAGSLGMEQVEEINTWLRVEH